MVRLIWVWGWGLWVDELWWWPLLYLWQHFLHIRIYDKEKENASLNQIVLDKFGFAVTTIDIDVDINNLISNDFLHGSQYEEPLILSFQALCYLLHDILTVC